MGRISWIVLAGALLAGGEANAQATVFEGARVITGDGAVIENGAFVVENGRFTQIGRRADVMAPASAPRIDLSGTGLMVPDTLTRWDTANGRYAGVSSFGMSGTNAHVVLGPAPDAAASTAGARSVAGFSPASAVMSLK